MASEPTHGTNCGELKENVESYGDAALIRGTGCILQIIAFAGERR